MPTPSAGIHLGPALSGLLNRSGTTAHTCAQQQFYQGKEKVMKVRYKVALSMVASLALGAVAVQSLHAQAKPSSDAEKIANAMTAGPVAVSSNASVVEMNEDGSMKVLRKDSGEWTCVPDDPNTPGNDPMCLDPNAMEWLHAYATKSAQPDKIGFIYMLQGGWDFSNTDPFATQPEGGKANDYRTARNGRRTEDKISPRI
jgi:hypothetical protein